MKIKKKLIIANLVVAGLLTCLLFSSPSFSKSESDYAEEDCSKRSGEVEHILENRTRVDCLTNSHAIEYDYSHKWYECVTQALYYEMKTGKKAACGIIFVDNSDIEKEHYKRARRTITHYHLPVKLFRIR